jgi:Predicted Zn-dependent peptidases
MKMLKGALSLIMLTFLCVGGYSQGLGLNSPVPVDPNFRMGVLDNGLHYYIRHNATVKERADFYIAQNVGAILEEDPQNGLAHFLEHMAFNGTKNYPDKKLIESLEKIGVKFGENINAFTSLDETVYNLSDVPVARQSAVDSAVLILHDWSGFISLKDDELDNERGVIREEWRTGRGADRRMSKELLPTIFAGSKYAIRDVIGDINVINGFDHKVIREFYHKWYRPDLQSIVIVGDVDVDKVEQYVKTVFQDIPKRENPAPRPFYDVPDNTEPIIGIASDPEARNSMVRVYYKRPAVEKDMKNMQYFRTNVIKDLVSSMLRSRLNELVQKPNPPFVVAFGNVGSIVRTKDAFVLTAIAKNGQTLDGLGALIREDERMKRFGFTGTELDRAKSDYLSNKENLLKEKDKQKNETFVWACVENFLTGEPMPSIEFDYQFSAAVLPTISLDELNTYAKSLVTDTNMVVTITGPEKEGVVIPVKEDVLKTINAVKAENIQAYVDQVSSKPLIEKIPVAGKVKSAKEDATFGTTEWTLSNGAKVVFKKTDFKDDQIVLEAFGAGGTSLVSKEDIPSITMAADLVSNGGVGEFSSVELGKMLAGKVVDVRPQIDGTSEGVSGTAAPKDFETMLQLVYLYFTQPKADEATSNSYMERLKAYFANVSADPRSAFRDSISVMMANHNQRVMPMNVDFLNKVNYSKAIQLYKERFADASAFTFVFAGNIKPDDSKALIETYIGGLPSLNKKVVAKDNGVRPPVGKAENNFTKQLKTPKTSIYIAYTGKADYTLENIVAMDAIESILTNRYTETIREKEGGSYGVGVRGSIKEFPVPSFNIYMVFDTDPKIADKMMGIIFAEVDSLMKNGPAEETLAKAKEHFITAFQQNVRENNFWTSTIREKYENGLDSYTDYLKVVNSLTPAKIKAIANKFFGQNNVAKVVMSPAE